MFAQVARRQSGLYNWRGGEGSQTDWNQWDFSVDLDGPDTGDPPVVEHPTMTTESTGLVYMQARYYEPETGRFTQADAVSYGMESFATGQNNRWVYCANDPVNASDPSGAVGILLVGVLVFLLGFVIGMYLQSKGYNLAGSVSSLVGWLIGLLVAAANLNNTCGPPWLIGGGLLNWLRGLLMTSGLSPGLLFSYGGSTIAMTLGALAGALVAGVLARALWYDMLWGRDTW